MLNLRTYISNKLNRLNAVTGASFTMGMGLAVIWIMKIKDHVENPSQAHLKDGAIRLAVGGALFALPIITEAMLSMVGDDGNAASGAIVKKISSATDLSD